MELDHLPSALVHQCRVILNGLISEYAQIEANLLRLISSGSVSDSITPEMLCVSPSDFGFHNAIQSSSSVKFFDFEFAGWDDPAKTLIDFVLQPRVPLPYTISPLITCLQDHQRTHLTDRCSALAPVLRFKWYCIILAFMRPKRHSQMLAILSDHDYSSMIHNRVSTFAIYKNRAKNIYA